MDMSGRFGNQFQKKNNNLNLNEFQIYGYNIFKMKKIACGPSKEKSKYTCFSKDNLIKMAEALNKSLGLPRCSRGGNLFTPGNIHI